MRFRFRGTRGSLPSPGPETVRFGGNTTCIEVRSDSGDLIVLDAGTGIRALGIELMQSLPVECHLFISHTHWDHIQGLPFFVPLFVPGNVVTLYGPPDPLSMTGIDAVLTKQMAYPHFPVREAELKADVRYETLSDGQVVDLGFATVTALLMNHPAMNFGFKVECDGRALFFSGDHEPFYNIYEPGDADFDDYERVVQARHRIMLDFLRDVDVLIADAQYTEAEYATHTGWGHSTYERVLNLAREAGVGRTFLTHHDTTRTDRDLEREEERLLREWKESGLAFQLAREGDVFDV
jgi:phosphoribosyl 1,2-cyclic phosphodiesterase